MRVMKKTQDKKNTKGIDEKQIFAYNRQKDSFVTRRIIHGRK